MEILLEPYQAFFQTQDAESGRQIRAVALTYQGQSQWGIECFPFYSKFCDPALGEEVHRFSVIDID